MALARKISKPDAFREIVNAWKSDDSVAAVALDAAIGKRAAELMGWRGARLAQDDVLWKPPGAQGVSYHTDGKYVRQLRSQRRQLASRSGSHSTTLTKPQES